MEQLSRTREIVVIGMFTALTCLVSLILKWGGDVLVPFSLLPMMALLAGALLGSRAGAMSIAAYTVMGLIGIPVFAKPPYGGPMYVVQPTFGFLLGFIAAAFVVGRILERHETPGFLRYLLSMTAGITVYYAVGLPYLWLIVNFYLGKAITAMGAIKIGFLPFIGLDLVKAGLASVVAHMVAQRVKIATRKPA